MATITSRKGKKGIRYTSQIRITKNGERYTESRTFDSRRAAERWGAAREKELEAPGAIRKAQADGLTVGALIDQYLTDFAVEYRYGRSKLADLKRIKGCDIAQIQAAGIQSKDLVDHIRQRRAEGVGPATATNDLAWLRVVLKRSRTMAGVDVELQQIDDAIEHCRSAGLISRPAKRDRRPTLAELDKILEFLDTGRHECPMVEIVLFALFSSRRQDEITRLRWEDLDGSRALVRDMKDPRSKAGNDHWVTLTPEALAIIQRQQREEEQPLIFPYNSKTIGANFTRAKKVLGIGPDLVFHSLRHECASWLFELGWSIPQVAMVTGHRSWQTLQRYTHLQEGGSFDKYDGWQWRPTLKPPEPSD